MPCLLPARRFRPPRAVGMLLNAAEAMTGSSPICHILEEGLLRRDMAVGRGGLFLSGPEDPWAFLF